MLGMLLAPAVVANLLANPDVAVNLESVLRRVMPLDWQEQVAVFARATQACSAQDGYANEPKP